MNEVREGRDDKFQTFFEGLIVRLHVILLIIFLRLKTCDLSTRTTFDLFPHRVKPPAAVPLE